MLKGFKYRLYPTVEQEELLAKHFGSTRLVYNLALNVKEYAYSTHKVNISYHELATEQLKDLKAEFSWLKEVNSQSLQSALRNLDTAYINFFKHGAKFPQYKSKHDKQSFSVPQHFHLEGAKLIIPKFLSGIRMCIHRPLKGVMKSVTISKTTTGKYFASILCETKDSIPIKLPVTERTSVGIDLGIKNFVVLSDGTVFDNPKYLTSAMVHLKWMQRQLSRKVKGSNRRALWKQRVSRQHETITAQRKDFTHKVSFAIVKQYDTVCFETLNISGMMKNHKLAGAIGDVGWGMFIDFVKYKEEWKGGSVLQLGTFDASTIECSDCGHINRNLTLADREWDCPNCGKHHERDENAAKVIKP